MGFATEHGLNALKIGMLWVFSSGGKIFVYQSGVLVIGYSYGTRAQVLDALGERFYFDCSIEETKVCVKMKMYKIFVVHYRISGGPGSLETQLRAWLERDLESCSDKMNLVLTLGSLP